MRRLTSALAAAVIICAVAVVITPAQVASAGPAWWNASYSHRHNLAVTTTDATANGYSVSYTFDHAAQVSAGKSLSSGNDVRLLYFNGTAWSELDRLIDPKSSWNSATTKIWFRTQTAISASTANTSYWLYFGNPSAATPPANGNNIFDVYDDFSGGSLNTSKWWTFIPVATEQITQGGGKLRLHGYSNSYWRSYQVQFGTQTGYESMKGFAVESTFATNATLGPNTTNGWSILAGLNDTQLHLDQDYSQQVGWYDYQASTWTGLANTTVSGSTINNARLKTTFDSNNQATYWENGVQIATRNSTPTDEYTALLGFAPGAASETFDVSVDDVWVRKFVTNEPTVTLHNVAPNNPSGLAQFKADGTTSIATGSWASTSTVVFKATASDPDPGDQSALCVELQPLATPFTNSETSCGSVVASGATATHSISVANGQNYHWQARLRDSAGEYSGWVQFNSGNSAFRIDTANPVSGTVYDGSTAGVQNNVGTTSLSDLSANWSGFSDSGSGINRYEYSIGTTVGGTNVKGWTNSAATSATASSLSLKTSERYYFNVRTVDNAGNVSSVSSSLGQVVEPFLSATVSGSLDMGRANADTGYTMTGSSTVTTSTNAFNGYEVSMYALGLPANVYSSSVTNTFSGTWTSPAAWSGTGFGYTSSDPLVKGSNRFASGTAYARVPTAMPGDVVADHPGPITGTAINNESFTTSFRLTAPANQPAGRYATTIVFTVTPSF